MKNRMRTKARRHDLRLETLERRALLAIDVAGFVPDGANFYFEINGDNTADVVLLGRNGDGDLVFEAYSDDDGDGFQDYDLYASGSVSQGEINLAKLALPGNPTFAGVRLNMGGGNDLVLGEVPAVVPGIPSSSFGVDFGTTNVNITANGGAGNDTLRGGNGRDILNGEAGNDVLEGNRNRDTLDGGIGDDDLIGDNLDFNPVGGLGNDEFDVDTTNNANLAGNITIINADIENIDLNGGSGNDTVDNRAFTDVSTRVAATNTVTISVSTGAGNDTVFSQLCVIPGTTVNLTENLNGGAGSDTISYAGFTDPVSVNLATGVNNGCDNLTSFENVTGGSGDDILVGDGGANVINGGDGNDVISGGGGADTLNGGNGDDEIDGGAGNDTINGGNGNDILTGNGGNDTINGDAGDDELYGNNGNDILTGGDGTDLVFGGPGTDTLVVPWTDLLEPFNPNPAVYDAYFGGTDGDTFRVIGVPVATSTTTFTNAFDTHFAILAFLSRTDYEAFLDNVQRENEPIV